MIVSLLYRVSRRLRSVPAVLLRRDTSKQAELLVLRHENAVLRRQLKSPVRYEPADRLWFAALSSLIPRRRWHDAFPVAPATLLGRHRRFSAAKWDYTARRARIGRPPATWRSRNLSCAWPRRTPVGTSQDPRRAGPARTSDCRLDGVGDPPHGRQRPGSTPLRSDMETVPDQPGARGDRRRLLPPRRRARQTPLRPDM